MRAHDVCVDFRSHGIVSVRLLDATPVQIAAVAARLGAPIPHVAGDADITVRFVPRLDMRGVRYWETGRIGYTEAGVYLLRYGKKRIQACVPIAQVGGRCEIVCDAETRTVPFLDLLIRLASLARGYASLHASAFEYNGVSILVAASAHGGKTSAALAFAPDATLISDDLVLIDPARGRMLGTAAPIAVSEWQLVQLPHFRDALLRQRIRSFGARTLDRLERTASGRAAEFAWLLVPSLRRRMRKSVPADAIFEQTATECACPAAVFIAATHEDPRIDLEPLSAAATIKRLGLAFRRELLPLTELYYAFQSEFPESRNPLLEAAPDVHSDLLREAFSNARTFELYHPYPVALAQLATALRPHCFQSDSAMSVNAS